MESKRKNSGEKAERLRNALQEAQESAKVCDVLMKKKLISQRVYILRLVIDCKQRS